MASAADTYLPGVMNSFFFYIEGHSGGVGFPVSPDDGMRIVECVVRQVGACGEHGMRNAVGLGIYHVRVFI